MSDPTASIAEFVSIAGCGVDEAAACLAAHDNDLQRAIGAYFDGWRPQQAPNHPVPDDNDSVREPIAATEDKLLDSQDLDFVPPHASKSSSNKAHKCGVVAFRNFRDEARTSTSHQSGLRAEGDDEEDEGAKMEEELIRKRAGNKLAEQFRRPTDLAVDGTFEAVREQAAGAGLLLVVNVQDVAEFASHVLNRDVWADASVRAALRGRFVLWQCGSDCDDARRFVRLYKVPKLPCVCVVDALTGELVRDIDVPMKNCVADAAAVARQCLLSLLV